MGRGRRGGGNRRGRLGDREGDDGKGGNRGVGEEEGGNGEGKMGRGATGREGKERGQAHRMSGGNEVTVFF